VLIVHRTAAGASTGVFS